jgi:hypothetical protein
VPTHSTRTLQQSPTKAAANGEQGTEADAKNLANNPPFNQIGWTIAPNPVSNEMTLNYNFKEANTLYINIFNDIGQLVTNYQLPYTQTWKLEINVTSWQNFITSFLQMLIPEGNICL